LDSQLVIEKGGTPTRAIRLRRAETIIGRRSDCTLRIPSTIVSRRHCCVGLCDGYLTVEDLGSRNGTYVNGARVSGRQVLWPGDRLLVGPVLFVVEYQPTQEVLDRLLRPAEEAVALIEEPDEALPVAAGEDEATPVEAVESQPGLPLPSDDEVEATQYPPP
jgi:pSer/pThr/pTyr-binding forkhead associated (FHA) protein